MKNKTFCTLSIISLIILYSSFCMAEAKPKKTINIDESIAIALSKNPEIESSKQDIELYKARITQATSAYYPQVSSKFNYSLIHSEMPGVLQDVSTTDNNYNASISALQNLYNFGKTSSTIEKSINDLSSSQNKLIKTTADIILSVKKAYYNVLKAEQLKKVQEESLDLQDKHLEQARAMHKIGLKPKYEVRKGEIDRAQTRLQLIQAGYDVNSAYVSFTKTLGGQPFDEPYSLAYVPEPSLNMLQKDLIIEEAIKNRPEIADLDAQIKAAKAYIKVVKSTNLPSLNANASYSLQNTDISLKYNSWQVGMTFEVPIFTGFRVKGEIYEANSALAKLNAFIENQKLSIIQDVEQSVILVNKGVEKINASRLNLEGAMDLLQLVEGRYKTGVGNAIEYHDANMQFTTSKSDLVQALYDYLIALSQLDYALGRGLKK
ncbi:MAG: TolC family protein [Desulfobacterales bacterium]|nr:TolC family protein [Desulfobacterales bacterium]